MEEASFNRIAPLPEASESELRVTFKGLPEELAMDDALARTISPLFLMVAFPPAGLLMPVIVNVAAVLVREISPLPELVALKLVTVLEPLSVCPDTELVVKRPVVLTRPAPLSVIEADVPRAVRLTAPLPAAVIVPVTAIVPVLFTETLPPTDWLILVIVSGAAVLVRAILPRTLLIALKLDTALTEFSVVPPLLTVRSVPAVIMPV